ncbi:hypothetical protein TKK_0005262 [Trichogramma kaykai]
MQRILLTLPRLLLFVVATATTISAHHDHHEASVIGGIRGSSGLDGSLRHQSHVNLGSSLHGQSNRAAELKLSSEGIASDLGGMIDSVLRYHQDVRNQMNLDFSGFGKSSVSGQGSGQLIGGAGGIVSLLGSAVGSQAGKLNVVGGGAADQRAMIDDDVGGGIGALLGRASGSAGLVGNINVNGRVGGTAGGGGSVVASETGGSAESVGSIVIVDDGATAEQESRYENQELSWVIPTQNVQYEMIDRKNDDENDDDRQEILVILDGSKGEEGVSSSIRAETGPEIERLIILEEPSSSSNQRLAEQILTIKLSTKEEEVREEEGPKESSSSSSAAVVVSVLPSSILSEVSRVAGSSAISKPLSYNAAGTSAAPAAGGADAKVNLGLNFNNYNNNNQARNNEDLHASIAEYTNNLKNSIRTKFGGALDGGLNVKTSGSGAGAGLFNLVNII